MVWIKAENGGYIEEFLNAGERTHPCYAGTDEVLISVKGAELS